VGECFITMVIYGCVFCYLGYVCVCVTNRKKKEMQRIHSSSFASQAAGSDCTTAAAVAVAPSYIEEKHLFHGTSRNVIPAICTNSFDWRHCGTHGTAFGQGTLTMRVCLLELLLLVASVWWLGSCVFVVSCVHSDGSLRTHLMTVCTNQPTVQLNQRFNRRFSKI